MKKNELVHMHALLRRIAMDFVDRGIVDREDFTDYERLGVSPMTLRASRDEHEEAVLTLASALARVALREAGARPGAETRSDAAVGATADVVVDADADTNADGGDTLHAGTDSDGPSGASPLASW
jgi:hypothetical protein